MSLSFPVLLSAVPLYAIDWTQEVNQGPQSAVVPERCWFSDGGICSNIPVHFFDSMMPSRPTFAINLTEQEQVNHQDQSKNVSIPRNNGSGLHERWLRFDRGGPALVPFLASIVETMQTWSDQTQMKVPGVRDRIVHVAHDSTEGGLNLTMPGPRITELSERGREAAVAVQRDFSWDNHVWVRFRNLMFLLDRNLHEFAQGYGANTPGADKLAALLANPPSYAVTKEQAALAEAWANALRQMHGLKGAAAGAAPAQPESARHPFAGKTPRPVPELRVKPRI